MAGLQLKHYATDPTRTVTVINMFRGVEARSAGCAGTDEGVPRRAPADGGRPSAGDPVADCYSPPF